MALVGFSDDLWSPFFNEWPGAAGALSQRSDREPSLRNIPLDVVEVRFQAFLGCFCRVQPSFLGLHLVSAADGSSTQHTLQPLQAYAAANPIRSLCAVPYAPVLHVAWP